MRCEKISLRNSDLEGDKKISFYCRMYAIKMLSGMLILVISFQNKFVITLLLERVLVLEHLMYHTVVSFGF